MKHFFTFIFLLVSLSTIAQTGIISGTLTDKETGGQPLPFANVLLKGTQKGSQTDFDGNYIITNVEPGTYTIEFSFVGYQTTEKVNETEAALLLDQKKAITIKQSIGAQELARKGVSDAAGAVAKISGISKQEGGGNVYVRGLGDRYFLLMLYRM